LIKDICNFNGLQHLTDDEAMGYLKLLDEKHKFELDEASKYFCNKSTAFWKKILIDICKVQKEIAEIWIQNKSNMITSSILYHYRVSGINKQMSQEMAKFTKMSRDDITGFIKLRQGRNFVLLIGLLDAKRQHSFTEFDNQTRTYMELDNSS
jgi:hypothetical protein